MDIIHIYFCMLVMFIICNLPIKGMVQESFLQLGMEENIILYINYSEFAKSGKFC